MWQRITVLRPCWKEPLKDWRIKNIIYCVCTSPELEPLPKIISTYRYVPKLFHLMSFISPRITLWTWPVWTLRHRNTTKLILRLLFVYLQFLRRNSSCVLCNALPPRVYGVSDVQSNRLTSFVGLSCCSLSLWTPRWFRSIYRQAGRSKCRYFFLFYIQVTVHRDKFL